MMIGVVIAADPVIVIAAQAASSAAILATLSRPITRFAVLHDRSPDSDSQDDARRAGRYPYGRPETGVTSTLRRPGPVAEQRQRDIDVAAQRLTDGRPALLAAHQRLPRVEVLRLVEVAVGDIREVFHARDREEVVAVGGFPHVDEVRQLVAVIPQVAGADLEPPRRAVMRMAGDAQRALTPDFAQDRVGGLVGADVLLDVERDDVRVLAAAQPVLRHLGARDDEHAVALQRARRASGCRRGRRRSPLHATRTVAGRAWPDV